MWGASQNFSNGRPFKFFQLVCFNPLMYITITRTPSSLFLKAGFLTFFSSTPSPRSLSKHFLLISSPRQTVLKLCGPLKATSHCIVWDLFPQKYEHHHPRWESPSSRERWLGQGHTTNQEQDLVYIGHKPMVWNRPIRPPLQFTHLLLISYWYSKIQSSYRRMSGPGRGWERLLATGPCSPDTQASPASTHHVRMHRRLTCSWNRRRS